MAVLSMSKESLRLRDLDAMGLERERERWPRVS